MAAGSLPHHVLVQYTAGNAQQPNNCNIRYRVCICISGVCAVEDMLVWDIVIWFTPLRTPMYEFLSFIPAKYVRDIAMRWPEGTSRKLAAVNAFCQ